MSKKQVKVSLSLEDLELLEDMSRETGRSLSSLIREAVRVWLIKPKKEE